MKRMVLTGLLEAAFGCFLYGQTPSITAVVNAASGNVQTLPNGGVAQGAIFTVIGSHLGPASLSIAPSPSPARASSARR